jgi:hypothetical protein
MNKEDIWVAKILVPVTEKVSGQANDVFDQMPAGQELKFWNIYSPLWAPVKIGKTAEGKKCLVLQDWDKADFAKAERVIPPTKKLAVEFVWMADQNNKGVFQAELQDTKGSADLRLIFDSTGSCKIKAGYRYSNVMKYKAGQEYHFRITCDVNTRFYQVFVDGREAAKEYFFAPVESLSRVVFRTGEPRRFPDPEAPFEQSFDVPGTGDKDAVASWYIASLKTFEE